MKTQQSFQIIVVILPPLYQHRNSSYADGDYDVFWYEKNLFGDVISVYSDSGYKVLSYSYDAFGNYSVSGNLDSTANSNPFKYRGYYYDSDLTMYYLNSRYYDQVTGRFISADVPEVTTVTPMALTDKNLYAYCDNNPVMRRDDGGEFWHIVVGAGVGVISQYISDVIYNAISGETGINVFKFSSSAIDYLAAGASGALAATGINAIGSKLVNTTIDTVSYSLNHAINGEEINAGELMATATISFATSHEGINGGKLRGIHKRSKQVLETAVSPKKIALYTSKISGVKATVAKEIFKSTSSKAFSGFTEGIIQRYDLVNAVRSRLGI